MNPPQADYTFYRRFLPHWQPEGAILFVSYRLAGSLPRPVLDRLRAEKARLDAAPPRPRETPSLRRLRIRKRLFALTDEALDEQIREAMRTGWKVESATNPAGKPGLLDPSAVVAPGPVAPAFQPGIFQPRLLEKRLWLSDPRVAEIVRGSLFFWDGKWFRLHRYVIMPNHVHILIEPLVVDPAEKPGLLDPAGELALLDPARKPRLLEPGLLWPGSEEEGACDLEREEAGRRWLHAIMHSIKGYSAREANRALGRRGSFWQREFFDHWARNDAEYGRIVEYMDQNPVRSGLCAAPEQWRWSSAGEERRAGRPTA